MSSAMPEWLRRTGFAFGACVMLLCVIVTAVATDSVNKSGMRDVHHSHLAFVWYLTLLCLLVACLGLGFAIMQRNKPGWLLHSPFVLGAIGMVLCSMAAAAVFSMSHRGHRSAAWFLLLMLVVDTGLCLKMMWRNGRGSPWVGLGTRVNAGE